MGYLCTGVFLDTVSNFTQNYVHDDLTRFFKRWQDASLSHLMSYEAKEIQKMNGVYIRKAT